MAVLELFEGKEQSNSTAFSSHTAPHEPLVIRHSFIMPMPIYTMATTITEKGITSKSVICKFSRFFSPLMIYCLFSYQIFTLPGQSRNAHYATLMTVCKKNSTVIGTRYPRVKKLGLISIPWDSSWMNLTLNNNKIILMLLSS